MNKTYIILLTAVALLVGCSPEKQLQRALKRKPDLLKADTLITHDTVTTTEVKADTTLVMSEFHYSDTIVLEKEKLTVKVFNNYHDSTIYIEGHCKPDTVVVEGQQITNTITKEPDWLINLRHYLSYWWLLVIIVISFLAIRFFIKASKPF